MELNIKSQVSFSVQKEERLYQFIMPSAAPAGEAYDVLYECLNKVVQLTQENAKSMERKADKIEG